MVCCLVAVAGAATACLPPPPATSTTSTVQITERPSGGSGPCVDPTTSIATGNTTRTVRSTATEFAVVITTVQPLCGPLDATAVIYAMPGNGTAWPQTLARSTPLRIQAAGTTTVAFSRACGAAQFDIVTGPVPTEVASPFAAPPLLFPLDIETAANELSVDATPELIAALEAGFSERRRELSWSEKFSREVR